MTLSPVLNMTLMVGIDHGYSSALAAELPKSWANPWIRIGCIGPHCCLAYNLCIVCTHSFLFCKCWMCNCYCMFYSQWHKQKIICYTEHYCDNFENIVINLLFICCNIIKLL